MRIVNLEQGMPTGDMAMTRLNQALSTARMSREKLLKIVHGYGSSGTGGVIKQRTRQLLGQKQRAGQIKGFVGGEEFSPFSPECRKLLDASPELSRDRDYNRGNPGITIVAL